MDGLSQVVGVVVPLQPMWKRGVAPREHVPGVVILDPGWVVLDLVNTCSGLWKPRKYQNVRTIMFCVLISHYLGLFISWILPTYIVASMLRNKHS